MANKSVTALPGVRRRSLAARQISARKRPIVIAIAACFASAPAWSNPTAPQVVNGGASFNQAGNLLTVKNTNGAIINWNSFSIGANETTRFIQSSAASSVLNRVITNDPSLLLGILSSNGRVWLVNPAGIMVGQGARIDVAGFVASTLNVRNEDFLAGRLNFGAAPNAGSIQNYGQITTPTGGSVYLVAPNVENHGIINAPNGEVILAAGQTAQLIDTGTPGVKVDVTGAESNVTNLGEIVAEAGRIGMAGVLVKSSGTLNASSVVKEGGRIFLKASKDAYVDGAGRIVTTGTKGGRIEVLGNRVAVMDQAQLDASGDSGGGTVLVGGDYKGKNPDIQNANITYFGPQASIKADAMTSGDGGKVIVWADDTTRAYGNISARGGAESGNGGFVETSGHQYLDVRGIRVDSSARNGAAGNWLLDPTDITIAAGSGSGNFYGGVFDNGGGASSTAYAGDINTALYGGDVTISTSSYGGGFGDITVNGSADPGGAAVFFTNTFDPRVLTLEADRDIAVHDGASIAINPSGGLSLTVLAKRDIVLGQGYIFVQGGAVTLTAGWGGGAPTVLALSAPVGGNGGSISLIGANLPSASAIDVNAYGSLNISGTGTSGAGFSSTGNMNVVAKDITLTAAYGGGVNMSVQGAGTQTITATNTLTLNGAASSSNPPYGNWATIDTGNGSAQNIAAGVITLNAGSYNSPNAGFGSSVSINSGGSQLITASAIALNGGAAGHDNTAYITQNGASGTQTINVTGGSISLTGGTAGSNNSALISSFGTQSIDAGAQTVSIYGGSLNLYGGGSGAGDRWNSASISHDGPYGGQVFNIYGGGSIYLKGGDGGDSVYGGYNVAHMRNQGSGGQAINFFGNGSSIALYGGSAGNGNGAFISSSGSQVIGSSTNRAAIYLRGGSGGSGNIAHIFDGDGSQTLYGTSITLTGDYGGDVRISGNGSNNQTQTINVTNALTLTGASSSSNPYGGSGASISASSSLYSPYGGGTVYGGTQQISAGSIALTDGAGGGTSIRASSSLYSPYGGGTVYGGTQQISAGSIALTGGVVLSLDNYLSTPYGGGTIYGGTQTIAAAGALTLTGATAPSWQGGTAGVALANYSYSTYGSNVAYGGAQQISAGSIALTGGSAGGARINAYGNANGETQTINVTNALTLNGSTVASPYGGSAYISLNNYQYGGVQQISAGSIALAGDAGGGAYIDATGTQSITASGTLTLHGSTVASPYGGIASIAVNNSLYGGAISQSVNAGSLTLTGDYGGGAWINAYGNANDQTQTITSTGALTLTGASSSSNPYGGRDASISLGWSWYDGYGGLAVYGGTQQITAGSIALIGGTGGGASIDVAGSGTQTITSTSALTLTGATSSGPYFGKDASISLGGSWYDGYGGSVSYGGTQQITADSIALIAGSGGNADIGLHTGTQNISATGTLALNTATTATIYSGRANIHAGSWNGSATQTISAGSIAIRASTSGVSGNASIRGEGGDQTINITGSGGSLNLYGGGSGAGDRWNSASISHNGPYGGQVLNIYGGGSIYLKGGDGSDSVYGGNNDAYISNSGSGGQEINFLGNGSSIALYGGSAGNNNDASIHNSAGSQIVNSSTSGAAISIYGGASGTNNFAQIYSGGAQNISASAIALAGGADGTYNYVQIRGNGDQQINASGINIQGGAGMSFGNYAQIHHGSGGGNQAISVSGGSVTLVAGNGTGTTANDGNLVSSVCASDPSCVAQSVTSDWAGISSNAGNQSLTFLTPGALSITGGSGGSRNQAFFSNNGSGTQTISGAAAITLTGGSSGGNDYVSTDTFHYLRNNASIFSPGGAQDISGSSLTIQGAANLTAVNGKVAAAGITGYGQAINIAGPITLQAGADTITGVSITSSADQTVIGTTLGLTAGSNGSGNRAAVEASGNQQVTLSGALTLSGGGATGSVDNYAQVTQLNVGASSQSVTASGGVTITGGSGDGVNGAPGDCGSVCTPFSSHNNAGIYNAGSAGQTVDAGSASIALYGGAVGNRNNAFIQNKSAGPQQINAGSLWVQGGSSGGMDSRIGPVLAESVFGSSYLTNGASIVSGISGLPGTQIVDVGAGAITLKGNNGSGSGMGGAGIASVGQQDIYAGTIELTGGGGTAVGSSARIVSLDQQTITGATTITVYGGAAANGHASLNAVGNQTISAQQISLYGSASAASIFSQIGNADIVVGTGFSNYAGATALSPTSIGRPAATGRWLIWAPDPAAVVGGGLVHDFAQYNAPYAPTPTAPLGSGNGLMYAVAPTLTPGFAAAITKVYDGTTQAPTSLSAAGVYGDTVSVSSGSILYDDKNVGVNKTVTAFDLSVSASDIAGKPVYGYQFPASISAAAGEITPASLSFGGLTADNKVYDATTVATLSGALTGMVAGDDLSLASSTASFADKNVGTAKPVTVTSLVLAGADVGNYSYSFTLPTGATLTADITPASLTVSGLAAENKVYDATTTATISGTPTFSGVLGTDVVALGGSASASFADKNVGAAKPVILTGLTLSGADAGNYTLANTSASATADITPASLTVSSLTANNKVYDATTIATITGTAVFSGLLGADVVALDTNASASFADKDAGVAKPVNVIGLVLAGADAGNYILTNTSASTTADITPASLTISGLTAQNKVYDATTVATITGTAAFSGVLGTDVVALGGSANASFADKNAGVAKPVNVTGLTLSGADAANYTLASTSASTTADITPASLTVTGLTAQNKVYDATTVASVRGALTGVLAGDTASVATVNAAFDSKNVGVAKPVTVTGVTLTGADVGNYIVTPPTDTALTADITPASLTVSGLAAQNKVYDATTVAAITGTPIFSGVLGTDVVALDTNANASFADKHVGVAKPVSMTGLTLTGADAGNYLLTNAGASASADIAPASLTLSGVSAANKVYDATTLATLTGGTLAGVFCGDVVGFSASGNFADKEVGVAKPVVASSVSLSGADAGNYRVTAVPSGLTADITAAPAATALQTTAAPVLAQVVNAAVTTTQQQPAEAAARTAAPTPPPPAPVPTTPGGSGPLLLSNTTQTIGGTANSFGGAPATPATPATPASPSSGTSATSATPASPASGASASSATSAESATPAGSGSGSASGSGSTASSGQGAKPAGEKTVDDNSSSGKPSEDKSASAKADEKKDDEKKKEDDKTAAKKDEGKPAAKKVATCS